MTVNSREKGKRGEREWAEWLRDHGVEARRGVQHSGGPESPDVVSDLPIHWEVKRQERLLIEAAVAQARGEAAAGKLPVVAHRRNGKRWLLTVDAEDLVRWCKEQQRLDEESRMETIMERGRDGVVKVAVDQKARTE